MLCMGQLCIARGKKLSVPYVWQYNGSLWYEVPVECAVLRRSVRNTYHEDIQ